MSQEKKFPFFHDFSLTIFVLKWVQNHFLNTPPSFIQCLQYIGGTQGRHRDQSPWRLILLPALPIHIISSYPQEYFCSPPFSFFDLINLSIFAFKVYSLSNFQVFLFHFIQSLRRTGRTQGRQTKRERLPRQLTLLPTPNHRRD